MEFFEVPSWGQDKTNLTLMTNLRKQIFCRVWCLIVSWNENCFQSTHRQIPLHQLSNLQLQP